MKHCSILILGLVLCIVGANGQTSQAKNDAAPQSLSDLNHLLFIGAQAGGGWDYLRNPAAYANVRLGAGSAVFDLGYDRLQGHNGAFTEFSWILPLVRVSGPQVPGQRSGVKYYLRFYGEPGLGYRASSGPFGGFASAKAMVVLRSTYLGRNDGVGMGELLPYVEYEHRFPLWGTSPLQGDNRLAFGLLLTLCCR